MENPINCSATVIPVCEEDDGIEVGLILRSKDDTLPNLLVAPGGKIESSDGELVDGVYYYAAEHAAVRELYEETGIELSADSLFFYCSLRLPNNRLVISFWATVDHQTALESVGRDVEWLTKEQVQERDDFAPGMKQEILNLFDNI